MSMFTELVIAFDFAPDVPAEVLAAFASVALDGDDQPTLEGLDPEHVDAWNPMDPDDDMGVPWSHDWGLLLGLGLCVYAVGENRASLRWTNGRWHLTARCTWQTDQDTVIEATSWMAKFCCPLAEADHPQLLGYLRDEHEDRPVLIWHNGSEFDFEEL